MRSKHDNASSSPCKNCHARFKERSRRTTHCHDTCVEKGVCLVEDTSNLGTLMISRSKNAKKRSQGPESKLHNTI